MAIRRGIVRTASAGGKLAGRERSASDGLVPSKLANENIRRTIMTTPTTDKAVLGAIERLTKEEHALYEKGDLTDTERARLRQIDVELDEAWDLLRQRRAKREFGQDPDEADIRPPRIVERYEG
jgi:hypothetical protein